MFEPSDESHFSRWAKRQKWENGKGSFGSWDLLNRYLQRGIKRLATEVSMEPVMKVCFKARAKLLICLLFTPIIPKKRWSVKPVQGGNLSLASAMNFGSFFSIQLFWSIRHQPNTFYTSNFERGHGIVAIFVTFILGKNNKVAVVHKINVPSSHCWQYHCPQYDTQARSF